MLDLPNDSLRKVQYKLIDIKFSVFNEIQTSFHNVGFQFYCYLVVNHLPVLVFGHTATHFFLELVTYSLNLTNFLSALIEKKHFSEVNLKTTTFNNNPLLLFWVNFVNVVELFHIDLVQIGHRPPLNESLR